MLVDGLDLDAVHCDLHGMSITVPEKFFYETIKHNL